MTTPSHEHPTTSPIDADLIADAREHARILRRADCNPQAALLGLVKAARDFDPDRGLLFKTFADHRIRGEVLDFFRSEEIAGYRRRRGGSCGYLAPGFT